MKKQETNQVEQVEQQNLPAEVQQNLPAEVPFNPPAGYSIFDPDFDHECLVENMGVGGIGTFDLQKIKIPSGGGIAWCYEDLEGEQISKDITGMIIHFQDLRCYWEAEFNGENQPPDCASVDCVTGQGNPGGLCSSCPFSQFGTGKNESGQACKQIRRLFVLMQGSMLPVRIDIPPTSLKPMKKYFMGLISKGIRFYGAVTRLTLVKDKNGDGVEFSRIVPQFVEKLDKGTLAVVQEYRQSIMPSLVQSATIDLAPIVQEAE